MNNSPMGTNSTLFQQYFTLDSYNQSPHPLSRWNRGAPKSGEFPHISNYLHSFKELLLWMKGLGAEKLHPSTNNDISLFCRSCMHLCNPLFSSKTQPKQDQALNYHFLSTCSIIRQLLWQLTAVICGNFTQNFTHLVLTLNSEVYIVLHQQHLGRLIPTIDSVDTYWFENITWLLLNTIQTTT